MRLPVPTPETAGMSGPNMLTREHRTLTAVAAGFGASVAVSGVLFRALSGVASSLRGDDEAAGRGEHEVSGRFVALRPWPQELVYELLDAHADTAELGGELSWDPCWAAHLAYLRALQRIGRETLAHIEDGQ
jgi:hypothetical protein